MEKIDKESVKNLIYAAAGRGNKVSVGCVYLTYTHGSCDMYIYIMSNCIYYLITFIYYFSKK